MLQCIVSSIAVSASGWCNPDGGHNLLYVLHKQQRSFSFAVCNTAESQGLKYHPVSVNFSPDVRCVLLQHSVDLSSYCRRFIVPFSLASAVSLVCVLHSYKLVFEVNDIPLNRLLDSSFWFILLRMQVRASSSRISSLPVFWIRFPALLWYILLNNGLFLLLLRSDLPFGAAQRIAVV